MTPIFASADIAALVAAFPPPSASKGRPSLLRSLSGNSLISTEKVLSKFRDLLERAPARVTLADLPRRLDVEKTDFLVDCYDGPLYYSRDGQSLIPAREIETVKDAIFAQLMHRVIATSELITGADISSETLDRLLVDPSHAGNVSHSFVDGGKRYAYTDSFVERVNEVVRLATAGDEPERIDLRQHFPGTPLTLLKQLGDFALSTSTASGGTFNVRDDCVEFIPAAYSVGLEKKQQAAYQSRVQSLAGQLRDQGFCSISNGPSAPNGADGPKSDESGLSEDVKSHFDTQMDGRLAEVHIESENSAILVSTKRLDEALETLRLAAPQEAARVWHGRSGAESLVVLKKVAIKLLDAQLSSELKRLLLKTKYLAEVEALVLGEFAKFEQSENIKFAEPFRERLLAPVQLYISGITTVGDATLKQHLEEYLGEHFRRDVIPGVVDILSERRLLLEKGRKKDVEKMQQACSGSKTLTEVHGAITKLAKKQRVELPSNDLLYRVKLATLQQKAKAVKKMGRGSDALQNLVWILLAQKSEGLFMSSGKDTSRMIKQYQTIGDAEVGRSLEEWRDKLKAGGNQPQEYLREMRQMAADAVEDVAASTAPT